MKEKIIYSKTLFKLLESAEVEGEDVDIKEEVKTPRIYNLSRRELISFLEMLKGNISKNINFSITEKYSGSHATVGILGTESGVNEIYITTKEGAQKRELFDEENKKRFRFVRPIYKTFQKYKSLKPGQKEIFNLELIDVDEKKPDYLSYGLEKMHFLVFNGEFESFTQEDADLLSSKYVKVIAPESIALKPYDMSEISQDSINELNSLIRKIKRHGRRGFFRFVYHVVEPKVQNMITTFFGMSTLNPNTPKEGIFVNMSSPEKSIGFKVPAAEFYQIQKLQYLLYGDIVKGRTTEEGSEERFDELINYFEGEEGPTKFGESLDIYIKGISDPNFMPTTNIRSFFSPEEFKHLCQSIIDAQNEQDEEEKYYKYDIVLSFVERKCKKLKSRRFDWHNMTPDDNYNIPEARQIRRPR